MKLKKFLTTNHHEPSRIRTSISNGKFVKEPKVLLVLFAINLFLITSCPGNIEQPYNELAANGQGGFKLLLGDTTGRAILPSAPNLSQFAVFELDFAPSSGGFAHNVRFLQSDAVGGSLPVVILVAGTYNLTVNAYLGGTTAAPAQLAAAGNASITINTGAELTENVQLKALLEGTTQGNFNWSANISAAGITAAAMTITGVTTGASTIAPVNLTSGANSSNLALNPGIYNVSFKLAKQEGTPVQQYEAEWNELLYIYSSLTSNFNMTFDNNFFHRIQYNVTFHFNDSAHFYDPNALTGLHPGVQSVLHAGFIGTAGNMNTIASRGYRFDGWYTTPDFAAGTEKNLEANPVLNDMTIYAKWTPNNITITLIDIDNMPAALGVTFTPAVTPSLTLSRTGAGGNPSTQNINVTGLNAGDTIGWSIKGKGVNASQNVTGTTSTINLDANNVIYNSLGWHTVELNIVKGGIQYRTNFVFQIIQ